MNTNKNSYTILYASVVVIVVAFLLAFVSKVLEPQSKANERIDKKKQILASLNIRGLQNSEVESKYKEIVLRDAIVDAQGRETAAGDRQDQDGFALSPKEIGKDRLPVYYCKVNGEEKWVYPMFGKGLWGGISGYLSLNADKRTIFGTYFTHESETAGLGARITEPWFQNQFMGKRISKEGSQQIDLTVVKNGQVQDSEVQVDGITGATLTSNGVNDMLQQSLANYSRQLNLDK
ncbi:MAG: NADH:ubiquinone reductase (Na(+)-transporting) subunit C [Bacteroidaceae bacterium]|nr:NADH:ubiquinone reductase (Na(+)-transporting) subunit C [Bacteroidaceae bacterium]